MAKKSVDKNISLALSGSGFLFYAHIGALCALEEKKYTVIELSGTSGGSIIAMLYSLGWSSAKIREIAFSKDWSSCMKFRWYAPWHWFSGLCPSTPLYTILCTLSRNKVCKETTIPLHIVSTNLTKGTPFIFSSVTTPDASLATAVMASATVPFIYPETVYAGDKFVDGGVSYDLPLNVLNGSNKIGISIYSELAVMSKDISFIDKGKRILELLLDSNSHIAYTTAQAEHAIVVRASSLGHSPFDTDLTETQKQDLFNSGYNAVMNHPSI